MPSRTSAAVAETIVDGNLSIKVLGELAVTRDGAAAALPPSRKTRALLAYLAVVDRPQRRERLCEMFWDIPDDPRGSLRWSLSRLRQAIGDVFETTRDTVALHRAAISVDYDRVRTVMAAGVQPGLDELEAVADLFHGGFLDDLSLPRCPEFEAWRTALATETELAQLRIRRTLVERLAAAQPARALVHARVLEAMNPGDESLAREVRSLAERSRQDALSPNSNAASGAGAPAAKSGSRLEQQIRYVTAPDGVRLAYATTGNGYPILKCANWMSDLQYDLDSSVWRHWIEELSRHNQLIRYDQRSNGLSDRDVVDLTFDAQLSDLETIADAAGVERFALLGISAGAALSVAYAVRHADRVSRLILYGGRPRGWKFTGTPADRAQRAAMVLLIRAGWGQDNPAFRQLFTSLFIPDATPEQMDWYNELQRRTVSPDQAARLQEVSGGVQISDLLEKVTVPTLVLHSVGDALVPFELGRELAIGIPGARFVALDSRNHILLAGEPAFGQFIEELRRFIDL
jgi:pimeloyl-ACP methyl ester carboxylesterase/DNA-binding SARP family transcriptional activator